MDRTRTIILSLVLVAAYGLPTVSLADAMDDARRFMLRGQEAAAMAKTPLDYEAAVREFSEAVRVAPDFADAWYNLALVQEKKGDLPAAIRSLQRYLELAPNGPDNQIARDTLVRWQYRAERTQQRAALAGVWVDDRRVRYTITIDGDRWLIKTDEVEFGGLGTGEMEALQDFLAILGTNTFLIKERGVIEFSGTVTGKHFVGERFRPAVRDRKSTCDIPQSRVRVEGELDADGARLTLQFDLEKYVARYSEPLPFLASCEEAAIASRERKTINLRPQQANSSANDLNQAGNNYYAKKMYAEAVVQYRKAAEQNFAQAQANLGVMYLSGFGVGKDYGQAMLWYRKAADQGHAQAQARMGFLYENGYGADQDYAEAMRWYRKAAEQNNAAGQYGVGMLYRNGRGVEKDYVEAMRWFRRGAESNFGPALTSVGVLFANGWGVERDDAEALRWFRKAAEQNTSAAKAWIGKFYEEGLGGLTKDLPQAKYWYKQAAEQGDDFAQKRLAAIGN